MGALKLDPEEWKQEKVLVFAAAPGYAVHVLIPKAEGEGTPVKLALSAPGVTVTEIATLEASECEQNSINVAAVKHPRAALFETGIMCAEGEDLFRAEAKKTLHQLVLSDGGAIKALWNGSEVYESSFGQCISEVALTFEVKGDGLEVLTTTSTTWSSEEGEEVEEAREDCKVSAPVTTREAIELHK